MSLLGLRTGATNLYFSVFVYLKAAPLVAFVFIWLPNPSACPQLSFLLLGGDITSNPGSIENVTLAIINIHSIQKKYPSVSNYVQANVVHAFAVSEISWSDDSTASLLSEITPPGYIFLHTPWLTNKGGGQNFPLIRYNLFYWWYSSFHFYINRQSI